ncbi:MAG: DEAD/DEAH box helicase [Desulfobacterales bacterium]
MEKPQFLTSTTFESLNLPDNVLNGLNDIGLTYCTPIQARTLPVALTGRDIAGQAQTGTGKTAAFLITIFTRLPLLPAGGEKNPRALIVAPTRELASQIFDEAEKIGRYLHFRLVNVFGGVDYVKQADKLKSGVDIVIGTPGRIIDYYKKGVFITSDIQIVVIDEADRLLDLGFAKDMRYILRKLPHFEKRQSMLFSATLSYRVMELTYEYMNLPEFISVTADEKTVKGVKQSLMHVGNEKKFSLLLGILEKEDWERVLIFVNTKAGVEQIARRLKQNDRPAEGITGDLPQKNRFNLMERFKDGTLKILVATDVASRGIHVENISHVINYDIPQDAENYIHRIGRTARAGHQGTAISLACEEYVFHLEALENMLGYKIPVVWPEVDWYLEDKSAAEPSVPKRRKKEVRRRLGRRVDHRPSKKAPVRKSRKSFPGSFFGFGPPPETESAAEASNSKKAHSGGKRKPRRKKKKEASESSSENKTKGNSGGNRGV